MLKVFGANIRKLRERKGLSQDAFARLVGLEHSYYGRIERGKINISVTQMYKIYHALRATHVYTVYELFDEK